MLRAQLEDGSIIEVDTDDVAVLDRVVRQHISQYQQAQPTPISGQDQGRLEQPGTSGAEDQSDFSELLAEADVLVKRYEAMQDPSAREQIVARLSQIANIAKQLGDFSIEDMLVKLTAPMQSAPTAAQPTPPPSPYAPAPELAPAQPLQQQFQDPPSPAEILQQQVAQQAAQPPAAAADQYALKQQELEQKELARQQREQLAQQRKAEAEAAQKEQDKLKGQDYAEEALDLIERYKQMPDGEFRKAARATILRLATKAQEYGVHGVVSALMDADKELAERAAEKATQEAAQEAKPAKPEPTPVPAPEQPQQPSPGGATRSWEVEQPNREDETVIRERTLADAIIARTIGPLMHAGKEMTKSVPRGFGLTVGGVVSGVSDLIEGFKNRPRPKDERFLAQWGAEIKARAEELFPAEPETRQNFIIQVVEGIGSSIPFMATGTMIGALGRAAGLSQSAITALGTTAMAGLGAGASADSGYELAAQFTDDEDQRLRFARLVGIVGLTEAMPFADLLRRIGSGKSTMLLNMAFESLEEGGQEGLQQFLQNLLLKTTGINPEQEVMEGVGRSSAVGAAAGLLTAGAASKLLGQVPEQVLKSFDELDAGRYPQEGVPTDAVQKPSATQVDVREPAGSGEAMGREIREQAVREPQPSTATRPEQQAQVDANPYMRMPIERVQQDANYGVRLAQEALVARADEIQPVSAQPVATAPDQAPPAREAVTAPSVAEPSSTKTGGARISKKQKAEAEPDIVPRKSYADDVMRTPSGETIADLKERVTRDGIPLQNLLAELREAESRAKQGNTGKVPIMDETGAIIRWENQGAAYPEGMSKDTIHALSKFLSGKKLTIKQAAEVEAAVKYASRDVPMPGEELAFAKAEKPTTVNEQDIQDKDLVYRNGEWHEATRNEDGSLKLANGEVMKLDDFDSVKANVVVSKNMPEYAQARAEFEKQQAAEGKAQPVPAQEAKPVTPTEVSKPPMGEKAQEAQIGKYDDKTAPVPLSKAMGDSDTLELGTSNILGTPRKVFIVRAVDTDMFGDKVHFYTLLFASKDQQLFIPIGNQSANSQFLKAFDLQGAEDRLIAFNEMNEALGGKKFKLQERIGSTAPLSGTVSKEPVTGKEAEPPALFDVPESRRTPVAGETKAPQVAPEDTLGQLGSWKEKRAMETQQGRLFEEKQKAQNIEAEAARRAREGAIANPRKGIDLLVDKIKNSFSASKAKKETAQANTDRLNQIESARQSAKVAIAEINPIRKRLSKSGFNDDAVVDDLNRVISEREYLLGGERFAVDDIQRLSSDELAGLMGVNRAGQSHEALVAMAMQKAQSLEMSVQDFSRKYRLSRSETATLTKWRTDAISAASSLEKLSRDAGLEITGGFIGGNKLYSHREYLRNLLRGGYSPSQQARAKAETYTMEAIDASVKRIEATATRLNKAGADMPMFLQTGDRQHIAALTDRQKEVAHGLKSAYDSLGRVKSGIGLTQAGDVSIARDAQAIKDAAEFFINEILVPQKSGQAQSTGAGSATDALLHRDLNRVYRELFGEIKDPAYRFALSRETQARNIANLEMMARLANVSGLFSDTKMDGASVGHTVRLGASQDINAVVTQDDRAKYGVLAGKWVNPSVARQLGPAATVSRTGVLGRLYGVVETGSGLQRGAMVLRPASVLRDKITNILGFAMASGDVSPTFAKHYKDAEAITTKLIVGMATKNAQMEAEARSQLAEIAKKGIYRSDTSSISEGISGAFGEGKTGAAWDNIMKARSMIADFPAKYAAYFTRLEKLNKWHAADVSSGRMTQGDLEAMAKKHVADTYDNRDAVPSWVKKISKSPLVTDYLTFKYSSTRAGINSIAEMVADIRNPKIDVGHKAARVAEMTTAIAYQGMLAMRNKGVASALGTTVATLLSSLKGSPLEAPEPVEEDIEDAIRFMGEQYYQFDSMTVFKDKNGKLARVIWGGGAITPFPLLVDLPTGLIDAGDIRGVSGKGAAIRRAGEVVYGGDWPMAVKTVNNAYRNYEEWQKAKWADAQDDAVRMSNDEAASEALHTLMTTLAKDLVGWPARTAFSERSSELWQQRIARIASEKQELNGTVQNVPKGFGPGAGMPVEEYIPTTRTTRDAFVSGVAPISSTVYGPNDVRNNILQKALRIRWDSREMGRGERVAKRAMTEQQIREYNKRKLAPMMDWKYHAEKLLKTIGEKDVQGRMLDILAKAGFSDLESAYIMGVATPSQRKPTGKVRGRGKTISSSLDRELSRLARELSRELDTKLDYNL